jgi:hypothetical protein
MKDDVDGAGEFGPREYLGSHKDPQMSDRQLPLGDAIAYLINKLKGVKVRLPHFRACFLAYHINLLSLPPNSQGILNA